MNGLRRGLVLPNWEAGTDPRLLVDAAVAAEDAGWDGVFLADHLSFPPPATIGGSAVVADAQPFVDPWITLAAIAECTERILLGTWVTPIARRQPWQAARDLATLDHLSRGRMLVGVGLGRRTDYEPFGQQADLPSLARRTDEALDVMAGLWAGQPVSFHGEFYDLDGAVVLPTPYGGHRVPILAGGLWPAKGSLRRGARWDGIMPHYPGDGVLPADGDTSPEDHVRDLLTWYYANGGGGDVMLLDDPPGGSADYRRVCREHGATWLLTAKVEGRWALDLDRIRSGP